MANYLNLGATLPGTGYRHIYEFTIPVLTGLEGAFLLGHRGQVWRNSAPGKADATVIGATPSTEAGYTTLNGSGYLQTDIAEEIEMTLIAVTYDPVGVGKIGFIGNFYTAADGGIAMHADADDTVRVNAVRAATPTNSVVDATAGVPNLVGFRSFASATSQLRNYTTGDDAAATSTGSRTVDTSRNIRIGSLPAAAYSTDGKMGLAMIYSRALSDLEMTNVTDWARAYMDAQGVTV